MPTYVAFLRAINLGAKRKVPMAELRECLAEAGFEDVATYIQTGNVRVRSSVRSVAKVADRMESALAGRFGFDIPCVVFTADGLTQVHDDALAIEPPPFAKDDRSGRYVILFKDPPTAEHVTEVAAFRHDLEQAVVVGRAAHVWVSGGTQGSQVFATLARVFAPGTNRSLNVLRACVERWC